METKGTGSIVQLEKGKPKGKCRKWQLRVSVGRNPHTGKYQTKTKRLSGTYTQAVKALEQFKQELHGRRFADGANATFDACAERYLAARARGGHGVRQVKKRTLDKERWAFNAVSREIGSETKMADIDANTLDGMFADMLNGDGAAGKKLSGTYLAGVHSMLRGLFAFAMREGIIECSPMEDVIAPSNDTKPRRALAVADYSRLVSALDTTDRMQLAVLVIACCGLRRSEVAPLTFGDVEGGVLRIVDAKTPSGTREVPMPALLQSAVRDRRAALDAAMAQLGMRVGDATPLLANELGDGVSSHYIGVWWQKHRAEFGLDGWTLHELRHSFVTLLSESGASMSAMREIAGHKSASTTIGVYAHASRAEKRDAVDAAIGMLEGNAANQHVVA